MIMDKTPNINKIFELFNKQQEEKEKDKKFT